MVFKKYFKAKQEQEDILFNIKESASSPYKWQQKTLIERLSLVPQYFTAYLLMFEIYVIYYVVVKPYGVVYFVITCVGLFADGTTYVQLVCLIFSFWAAITAVKIRVVLNNPKRLQWFYDIVGERRVKSKLFASPIAVLLISRSVPIIASLLGLDTVGEIVLDYQFTSEKAASREEAQKLYAATIPLGREDHRLAMADAKDNTARKAADLTLKNTQDTARSVYEADSKEIRNSKRTTETIFRKVLRSDQATQVIGAVQDTSKTVLGTFWSAKK